MVSWETLGEEDLAGIVGRAVSASTDLVIVADTTFVIRFASAGAQRVAGYDPSEMVGRDGLYFVHPDDISMIAAIADRATGGYVPRATGLYRIRHANGTFRGLELNGGPFSLEGEHAGFWLVARLPLRNEVYVDVLRRVLDEQPLSRALETIPSLLPDVGEKFCITCWASREPSFTVGHGLPPALNGSERRPGSPWDIAATTGRDFFADDLATLDPETSALASREGFGGLSVTPLKDIRGNTSALMTLWTPADMVTADAATRTMGIRELVEAAIAIRLQIEELRRTARSDSLTGLANRLAFHDSLADEEPSKDTTVFYIDLDGLKAVNDRHGHAAGDRLLQIAAERIEASVRAADLVARLGGDEFAVLCRNCGHDEARQLAGRILESLREPVLVGGVQMTVRASMGVASAPRADRDLLHRADQALYEAKRSGRDVVRFSS